MPCENCSGGCRCNEPSKTTEEKYKEAIKLLNKIAMLGSSELAYTKDYFETVNQSVRTFLKENA